MKVSRVNTTVQNRQVKSVQTDCEHILELYKLLQRYGDSSSIFQDEVKSYIDWTKKHRCSFPNNSWMRFTQKLKKCNFALTDELLDLIHTRVSEYTFQKSIENQLTFLE